MKNLKLVSVMMAGALVGLSACGKREAVTADVEGAVMANAKAVDHIDWETSKKHPGKLFAQWRFARVTSEDICPALLKRTPVELTIFEDEIKSKENETMVAGCRDQLSTKLDAYWKTQLAMSDRAPMNFRFANAVETRDLSDGGYFTHMDLAPKRVLLTFDDGPHVEHTDSILKTMSRVNAKALFFHMGKNVRRYPEIVKRVAADGHAIGSHSMTHACLPFKQRCATNNGRMLSFTEATAEISNGHRAVQSVLGWVDPFFRFPYGESSVELKKYLRGRQVGEFYWSNDSNDWRAQPPESVVRSIMTQLKRGGDRGVILMHDIQHRTAEALPLLMKELYYGGYQPVLLKAADPKARKNNKL